MITTNLEQSVPNTGLIMLLVKYDLSNDSKPKILSFQAEIACNTLGSETYLTWSTIKVDPQEIAFDSIDCSSSTSEHLLDCSQISDIGFCLNNEVVVLSCL